MWCTVEERGKIYTSMMWDYRKSSMLFQRIDPLYVYSPAFYADLLLHSFFVAFSNKIKILLHMSFFCCTFD